MLCYVTPKVDKLRRSKAIRLHILVVKKVFGDDSGGGVGDPLASSLCSFARVGQRHIFSLVCQRLSCSILIGCLSNFDIVNEIHLT